MSLFALSPEVNDFYTAGGFWVGVVSFVVGLAAFGVSIWQVRKALDEARKSKTAAEAARDAALKTFSEDTSTFGKFVGAFALRLLREMERSFNECQWAVAELRAYDLAQLLDALPVAQRPPEVYMNELRQCGQTFAKRARGQNPRITAEKWQKLTEALHTLTSRLSAPFAGELTRETKLATEAAPPGDRQSTPGENEGGHRELGAAGQS